MLMMPEVSSASAKLSNFDGFVQSYNAGVIWSYLLFSFVKVLKNMFCKLKSKKLNV